MCSGQILCDSRFEESSCGKLAPGPETHGRRQKLDDPSSVQSCLLILLTRDDVVSHRIFIRRPPYQVHLIPAEDGSSEITEGTAFSELVCSGRNYALGQQVREWSPCRWSMETSQPIARVRCPGRTMPASWRT